MTTETLTITDFLLARIAEDEAAALAGLGETVYGAGVYGDYAADEVAFMGRQEGAAEAGYEHLMNWMPARVLAECKAKRAIVESCRADYEDSLTSGDDTRSLAAEVLSALASIYADHPDFDASWLL